VHSRSSPILVNFGSTFWEHKFLTADISHPSCQRVTKFTVVRDLTNRHLLSEFCELWTRGPAIPCGDLHQSFSDALVVVDVIFADG